MDDLARTIASDGDLRRDLKSRHLQLIALGGIIGSGYFLGTGEVLSSAGPAAILAYAFGGVIVICVMLCLGELAVAMPVAGSFVTYSRHLISPTWASGVGWSYWLTWVTYVPAEMLAAGIIMESFFPGTDKMWWSLAFGGIIATVNLLYVRAFGEIEFWLAIIKIAAIVFFTILAVAILFGVVGGGSAKVPALREQGLLAKDYWALLSTMVLVLVNFQGAEIIGLTAGESENPSRSLAVAIRNVTWRIIGLYLLPLMALICIFPWQQAGVTQSVFAAALQYHGLHWAAGLFSFVVLTAAVSCSNSGLYGCSRALQALAREGLAPGWLGRTNRFGVPQNAALFSVAGCFVALALQAIDPANIFVKLLAMSGFSGAVAWISICWSQFRYRRQIEGRGGVDTLKFRVPFFPYVTLFGIWAQIACLALMATSDTLREPLLFGIPALLIPMLWYWISRHRWAEIGGRLMRRGRSDPAH